MGQRWIETKTVYAQELGGGTAAYTSAINSFNLVPDYAALYIQLGAVTAVLTVTQQVSLDGAFWQDPTNSTSVATGSILTGLTNATGAYIPFTPLIAPYIRLKLAATITVPTCTMKVIFAGDRL